MNPTKKILNYSVSLLSVMLIALGLIAPAAKGQTTMTFKPYQIHAEWPVGVAGTLILATNNLRIPTNGATAVSGANWVIADANVSLSGAPAGCTASLVASDQSTVVSDIPVTLSTSTAALNTNLIVKLVFDGTQAGGSVTLNFAATGAGLPEDDFYLPLDVARVWTGAFNAALNGAGNWSDASKWSGGAPGGNDAVVFNIDMTISGAQTNNLLAGTMFLTNSVVDNNYTIASLRFSQTTNIGTGTTNWQNLYINDGKTLKITGNSGFSVLKDVTLIPNKVNVSIWGTNGTFYQTNESANFSILNDYQSGTTPATILDMTGLGNSKLDVNRVAIGDIEAYPNYWNLWQTNQYSQNSSTLGAALPFRPYSTWKMALTNFIKAVYVDPYNYTNAFNRNYSMEIGRTSYGGGSSGNDYIVNMGYSNVFNVDSICVGGYACLGGLLQFQNAGSFAKFRGTNGTSRMSVFALSDAAHTPFGSTTGDNTKASPGADFRNGTVDMLVDRLYLSLDGTNVTASGKGVSQSSLYINNSSIIDANTAIIGYQSQGVQTNASYCYALMYVTNNATFKVNGNLTLGYATATIGSANTENLGYGQLLIGGPTGGSSTVQASNILVGGVSKASCGNKILLQGGATLIVSNRIADATPNGALGTLGLSGNNNTLTLFIDGSNPSAIITLTNLTSSGTGNKIVIGGVKNLSAPADVVLVYGVNPSVPIAASSFDAGISMLGTGLFGTLSLSSSNTINVHIISRAPNTNLVWRGTSYGGGTADWDKTTKNWLDRSTGLMTNYDDPDLVAFDDAPGYATNINIAGGPSSLTPSGVNMTNNTLQYTFINTSPNSISSGTFNKYGYQSVEIDAALGMSVNVNQGSLIGTGSGSVANVNVASGARMNFGGNFSGSLGSSGAVNYSSGTISGTLTVNSGGAVTNGGTVAGTFTIASGGLLYNLGTLENGFGASSLVSSGGTFINSGTLGQYNPAGGLLDVFGTYQNLGAGSTILHSVTLESGALFYPSGGGIGTMTVNSDGTTTPDAFPGAIFFRQGSTNVFNVDAATASATEVQLNYVSFGGSASARTQNGATIWINNTNTAASFAAGQSFQLIGSGGAPNNTGTSTNTYPVIIPTSPGSGLAWDLSKLWSNGSIGIVSSTSRPVLTNSFAADNSTGTNKMVASFSWDPSLIGYSLETLVTPNTLGLAATNWTRVVGSWTNTTEILTNIMDTNSVFYRLSFP
jgi:hypothetical protein